MTEQSRYVCISHVWADGMGNPRANALPACQLRTIDRFVQSLYPIATKKIPFWMDTLCCPSPKGEPKKKAIAKMREVYQSCDKALVLDNFLRSFSLELMSIFEVCALIRASPWSSRVWTLQEAVLPKSVLIQFRDGLFDLDVAPIDNNTLNQTRWTSFPDMRPQFTLLRELQKARGRLNIGGLEPTHDNFASLEPSVGIAGAVRSLGNRSTSIASDEALCLGSLIGCNMEAIFQADPDERMIAFLSCFQTRGIPSSFLFWKGGRLSRPGYRWAPNSLLGGREGIDATSITTLAFPSPKGLRCRVYHCKLSVSPRNLAPHLIILNKAKTGPQEWYIRIADRHGESGPRQALHWDEHDGDFSCIELVTLVDPSAQVSGQLYGCAMIFVENGEDGVIFGRRGDNAHMRVLTAGLWTEWTERLRLGYPGQVTHPDVVWEGPDDWCID